MNALPIVNIAGYRFVSIDESKLRAMQSEMKLKAAACNLKGTILLSTEGINSFLAGTRENIDAFVKYLRALSEFSTVHFKESLTDYQPFNRLLVRIKKEIIPMNIHSVDPEKKTAPYLSPEELKQWYTENRDMIVLDTRNDFEVALGTFKNATDLHIAHFREFPDAIDLLPDNIKEKPIVTFYTGGIRCEKAAELMVQKGFKNVYQLDGGILNYFEKCGGEFYDGDCFVFDQRVAVNHQLKETQTKQCFDCRTPLVGHAVVLCSHCGSSALSKMESRDQGFSIHDY